MDYRHLGLPNEDRLLGAGVYYGAGASEASLCGESDDVYVVGGDNSAGQAALYFSRVARDVNMLVRGESLHSSRSRYLLDRINSASNMHVLTNCESQTCATH